MILVSWRPSSWMQFSNLFLKSSMTRANNWRSIGRISWQTASFKSVNVWVCECKHAISNTPKGKNHTLKDRESEGATTRLRNGKWGARETCFEQWSLTQCSTGQVSITTEVANPKEKNSGHLIPPSAYLPSTTHSKDVRFPWVTLLLVLWLLLLQFHPCFLSFLIYFFCSFFLLLLLLLP